MKLGTKLYIAGVLVLPWAAIYPITMNERDIIWYALPLSGPPMLLAYSSVSRNTQYVWPNIAVYVPYFAAMLFPLCLYLNRRREPIGQVIRGVLVGLSLATHVALTWVSYTVWLM